MSKKKYDVCVKTGEYQDAQGNTKGRYLNVGAVIQTDNGHALLLDRTFNPAGLPNPDNRSNVLCSLFEPKPRGESPPQQSPPNSGLDDDIPF